MSFCGITMIKQLTVCEALDHYTGYDTGEGERGQDGSDSEDALEEEISEIKDKTEYDLETMR